MMQYKKSLIFAVLITTLFISACGGAATSTESPGSLPSTGPAGSATSTVAVESATKAPPAAEQTAESEPFVPPVPNPASVDFTLEESTAGQATIGPEGGSFELVDRNGTQYTLTVPEGALLSPVEITMTSIAGAEGEAVGDTFLAGVELQPEGLYFLKMVTIEINGDVIQEGVVGFAAQSGGQDFHLTHSEQAGGSLTISTTHFSEFGVSDGELEDQLEEFISDNQEALVQTALMLGADQLVLDALNTWAQLVQDSGEIGTYEEWVSGTASFSSLLQWTFNAIEVLEWDMNTPGLAALLNQLQDILNQWFEQTSAVVKILAEKCLDGELVEFTKIEQMIDVGGSLVAHLGLEREEELQAWKDLADSCLNFTLTWQANVHTTGGDFSSDIALGAEYSAWGSVISNDTIELEVEYIAGFWHEKCKPLPGFISLEVEVGLDTPNLGTSSFGQSLGDITAYVKIQLPVQIDCSPAGFDVPADAQAPFHGGALKELNKDREEEGRWKFDLEYNPGGGVVAQFEEGPLNLPFPDGTYELWQLLSLYVNAPAD